MYNNKYNLHNDELEYIDDILGLDYKLNNNRIYFYIINGNSTEDIIFDEATKFINMYIRKVLYKFGNNIRHNVLKDPLLK